MPKQSTLRRDDPRYLCRWRAERLRVDYYPNEAAARIIKENATDPSGETYSFTSTLNWIVENWASFRKLVSKFQADQQGTS